MPQFHWDADSYLDLMLAEVADYERLQDETAKATGGVEARRILELGTGTGETARRLLIAHPRAGLTGIDSSEPSTAADQLRWLETAAFSARLGWQRRDLAVITADRAGA